MGNSARGFGRAIECRQRMTYALPLQVTGDVATPTVSGDAEQVSIARNSIGDYTITLAPGAGRALTCTGMGATSDTVVAVLASTATTVQIEIRTGGALADDDCHLCIWAFDSEDET